MQEVEFQLCRAIPGESLSSLDQTDIETLFDFICYIGAKNDALKQKYVVINGKRYKRVDTFKK